ncbi:SBBP repeat-containing protein [Polluticoccus soli]|uniref:DUF7948 domain-containing protein n=1 Tax=Polluticoccus soli TaxID=3034150 RepID=UPI0023E2E572|nr:SBBP repeat-containing protein [Flavipsychrobacter sp. JY13-12]
MKQLLPISLFIALPWLLQAAPASGGKKLQEAPLSFIENKGQITGSNKKPRTDIDLKLEAAGVRIFIGDGQVHYMWKKTATPQRTEDKTGKITPATFETYRMDVELVGANKNAVIVKEQQQPYYENYYVPQCPEGVTAHSFGKVTYKNVYPNIDWVLYASNNQLKYDFIVRPGGKASDIRLRYKGATELSMKDGAVTARTPLGSVTEKKPYSYDAVTKKELPSSFIVKNNELRFAVAASENTVVIDPVLAWGTYYGEAGMDDYGEAVATDTAGNVFLAGYTYSDDDITDPFNPSFQQILQGTIDAFIVKLNRDGQRAWATYYGGLGDEFCNDALTNQAGEIYICGKSNSLSGLAFPPWVHQTSNQGGDDAFLARFNAGGQIVWGTFYGGNGDETCERMAIDAAGEVYITGRTASNNKIHYTSGFKSAYSGGGGDAYVAKFSTSGTVLWGTYFGDVALDWGHAIAVDANNDVFMTGETWSLNLYCTPDAELDTLIYNPQPPPSPPPPPTDISNSFIVKFSPYGVVLYSSYHDGWDGSTDVTSRPSDLCADSKGNVYMVTDVGKTTLKFNNQGKFQWVKSLGGNNIVADNEDNIYLAGSVAHLTPTYSTPGSYQFNPGGGWDGYLLKLDPTGNQTWGSYYGGANHDYIKGLALDRRNKLYVCGNTNSPSGITTPGTHRDTWTTIGYATTDAFIAKWHDSIATLEPFTDTIVCPPDSIELAYVAEVQFGATNTFYLQLSDANGSFTNPATIGSFYSNQSGTIKGGIPANITPGNGYRLRIVSSSPVYTTPDNGKNIRILEKAKPVITGNLQVCTNDSINLTATSTTPSVLFTWSLPGGIGQTGASVKIGHATETHAGRYVVTADNFGCGSEDSVEVIINPRPYVTKLTYKGPICEGSNLAMTVEGSMPDVSYKWVGPNGYTSTEQSPTITGVTQANIGLYYAFMTSDKGCVSDSNSLNVDIIKLEANIKEIELRTPGDTIKFEGSANRDGVTWSWTGPGGFVSTLQNPLLEDIGVDQRGDYFLTVSKDGCTASASTHVRVTEEISFELFPNPNKGSFTVKGNTEKDQVVNLDVVDAMGKSIYRDQVKAFRKHFNKTINMPVEPAAGVYILRLDVGGKNSDVKFVISE